MSVFCSWRPFWRPASTSSGLRATSLRLALAMVFASAGAWAQASATSDPAASPALSAADPGAPLVPVPRPALPAVGASAPPALPADIDSARALWQRLNAQVGEFARGHIDLLRWEQQNLDRAAPAPAPVDKSVLDMTAALRLSLQQRPALFAHANMNAAERNEVQQAYTEHVHDLQRAWVDAVTTRQRLHLQQELLHAAQTGADLGQRMVAAGNWSQARLLREQLLQAQAWQDAVNAQLGATVAEERLRQLLGAASAQSFAELLQRLPASLPDLPTQPSPGAGLQVADLEGAVLRSQPTLDWQRLQTQRQLAALAPAWRQAWAQALNAALDQQGAAAASAPWVAPEIGNWALLRDAALQRAVSVESSLLQAANQRRSMARAAWAVLEARHASALQAQHVLELQTALEQDALQHYNGMLISTWDLLAAARERLQARVSALQAQSDFWHSQADWQALLSGGDFSNPGPASH